jgi:hypothetical protein
LSLAVSSTTSNYYCHQLLAVILYPVRYTAHSKHRGVEPEAKSEEKVNDFVIAYFLPAIHIQSLVRSKRAEEFT